MPNESSAFSVITGAIERTGNCLLSKDPAMARYSSMLAGKFIAVEVRGLDIRFCFTVDHVGIHFCAHQDHPADTTISGTPLALLRLLTHQNGSSVLFAGDVEICGDTEAGQHFKDMLQAVEFDWEEQVSKITGDVIAHRIGTTVRSGNRWFSDVISMVAVDLKDYLQEEQRILPTRGEMDSFLSRVDTLRSDVDRLEKRYTRLLLATDMISHD